MFVFRAQIHKMLVKLTNREDPDQTASRSQKQSDPGLHYLCKTFGHGTTVSKFKNIYCNIVNKILIISEMRTGANCQSRFFLLSFFIY